MVHTIVIYIMLVNKALYYMCAWLYLTMSGIVLATSDELRCCLLLITSFDCKPVHYLGNNSNITFSIVIIKNKINHI